MFIKYLFIGGGTRSRSVAANHEALSRLRLGFKSRREHHQCYPVILFWFSIKMVILHSAFMGQFGDIWQDRILALRQTLTIFISIRSDHASSVSSPPIFFLSKTDGSACHSASMPLFDGLAHARQVERSTVTQPVSPLRGAATTARSLLPFAGCLFFEMLKGVELRTLS